MIKKIKLIIFVLVAILGILSILNFITKSPIRVFVVLSGSMKPKIKEGSIIFVKKDIKNIKTGDIVTFTNPNNPKENITHRIVGEEKTKNQTFYKTKGDANNIDDLWKIRKEIVWGKVFFNVPLLGYIVNFAQTKTGVILLIVLPLMIIIGNEFKIIFFGNQAKK